METSGTRGSQASHTATSCARYSSLRDTPLGETPAKERLWLYDTVSGTLRNYRRLTYGPALDFAPTGELAFSIGSPGGPSRLKVPVAPSFVLPGS
jgi:hypothetical protein